MYAIAGERAYVAGVHGSAGAIHAVVGDVSGWTSPTVSVRDPRLHDDPAPQVEAVIDAAFAAAGLPKQPLTAVVIGTGGAIDLSTGDIGHAPGLQQWQAHFVAPVRDRLGCPVHLEREITLAAVAEDRFGGDQTPERFTLLWVGDGLGISCIDQGAPFRGFWGAAGEIGYLPLPSVDSDPAPPLTFQDLAGNSAVRALAHAHNLTDQTAADAVRTAIARGNDAFLDELADRIALGLHSIATVIDPGNVVLSGTTAAAGGADLAERVETALARRTWQRVRILPAMYAHGEEAMLRAALLLATEHGREAAWGPAT